jgi:hypothetical protein
MSAAGIAACGAVLFFLALTLVYQCDRFGSRISQYDLLHILPRWTFFAPNPAMRDCHIVCRVFAGQDRYGCYLAPRQAAQKSTERCRAVPQAHATAFCIRASILIAVHPYSAALRGAISAFG